MAKPPKIYTRLTRNAAGVASYSSLWLAEDHLLIVSSTGYTESYSRVMLRDIKAFFITKAHRRAWWNFAWGTIAGVAGIRLILVLAAGDRPTVSLAFLTLGAVGVVWNTLLGEGCRVHLLTGVQTARLPALVRLKRAHRVIARLQPLIAAAQADLMPANRGGTPPPGAAADNPAPSAPATP